MEDVIALRVEVADGTPGYFLTWGRIQDANDTAPVVELVKQSLHMFELDEEYDVHVCTLTEAASAPYFYESFFTMAQKPIPFGPHYEEWKEQIDELMREGKELYFLGQPEGETE